MSVVWRKNPLKWRDFHREYGAQTDFMAYKLRLLWHTNPDFYAIWTVFIGGGGGLQFVEILTVHTPRGLYSPTGHSQHLLETPLLKTFSLIILRRTLFPFETHYKTPSENPSENLLRTFIEACVVVRPLGRAPNLKLPRRKWTPTQEFWCHFLPQNLPAVAFREILVAWCRITNLTTVIRPTYLPAS